ncbi:MULTISPECIES: porin [Hydrogenophaga]|uniref:Porin n=1 Tax=Hydrogenophaga electricum TaxID=1230953 RepID=A0ABQ6C735_9BURK|nr:MULTISPECIES: porin [Hydrogenophaga]GLS15765.1 porin [Hydrogenophaga electricum]
MKKTLIALAALASTAAIAQSTVTLYGKANVGLRKESGTSTTMRGGADGSDSRFGLRGTEDLGGGLKANFVFESGLNPATGESDAVMFQRSAWAGLSGGFGELRLGRQYTVGFNTSIGYMPSTYTSAQIRSGLGFNGVGSRTDAQIRYISPNFGGVQAHIATQLKGNAENALTEFAVTYGNGPVKAALYTSKTKNTDGNNVALNGSYDFGSFMVAAGYVDKAGDNTGKGAWIHLGSTFGAFSPYIQFAKNNDNDQDTIEVGSRYALSKRTAAYFHVSNNSDAPKKSLLAIGLDHNF